MRVEDGCNENNDKSYKIRYEDTIFGQCDGAGGLHVGAGGKCGVINNPEASQGIYQYILQIGYISVVAYYFVSKLIRMNLF